MLTFLEHAGEEHPETISFREKISTILISAINTIKHDTRVVYPMVVNAKVAAIEVIDIQAGDSMVVNTRVADFEMANHIHLIHSLHLRPESRQLFAMSTSEMPLRCRSRRMARADIRTQHRLTWSLSLPTWRTKEIAEQR